MKSKFIICLLLLLTGTFCFPAPEYYMRSYILEFHSAEELQYVTRPSRLYVYTDNNTNTYIGSFISSDERNKNKYDELCMRYNDMSYNRYERDTDHFADVRKYLSFGFTSITLVSDSDFDDRHRAGTPLDDIAVYMNISVKKYIDSQYKSTYDWGNPVGLSDEFMEWIGPIAQPQMHPIEKFVSELEPSELVLLGNGRGRDMVALIHFPTSPTLSRTHNITVTLTADDGRVFSDTIEMSFEILRP